jgi:hypothetical protein
MADESTAKGSRLVCEGLMDNPKERAFLKGNTNNAGQVLRMSLSKAARAVKWVHPEGEVLFFQLVHDKS